MGCEFSKLYNLEIHLENDLGIFEPLDVVAGHILIQVENDTSIHHCFLTLRGLAHFSFEKDENSFNGIGLGGNSYINSHTIYNYNLCVAGENNSSNSSSSNSINFGNANKKVTVSNHIGNNIQHSYQDNSYLENGYRMTGEKDSSCCERFQIILMHTEDLLKEYKTTSTTTTTTAATANESDCFNSASPGKVWTDTNDGSSPEFIITKGLHVFNFEFQLPANLPGSFVVPDVTERDSLEAFVIYNIKVEVVNVAHQVSHSRERDILVFNSLDLTQYPQLADKVTLKKEFLISECCAPKSRLLCELTVNKRAFVPGEIMKVEVLVKNGSTKPIESVQLSLLQNIYTRSENAEKTVHLRLFSISMGSVSPKRAHNFSDSIHIPPVVASGLAGCDIIDVNYSLNAQMFVFGDKSKKKDLFLKIPITIGSDPIKDTSFGDKEVVPCYALFNYETGGVIEYLPLKVTSSVHHMMPVYKYYKPAPTNPLSRSSSRAALSLSSSRIGGGGLGSAIRKPLSNPNIQRANIVSSSSSVFLTPQQIQQQQQQLQQQQPVYLHQPQQQQQQQQQQQYHHQHHQLGPRRLLKQPEPLDLERCFASPDNFSTSFSPISQTGNSSSFVAAALLSNNNALLSLSKSNHISASGNGGGGGVGAGGGGGDTSLSYLPISQQTIISETNTRSSTSPSPSLSSLHENQNFSELRNLDNNNNKYMSDSFERLQYDRMSNGPVSLRHEESFNMQLLQMNQPHASSDYKGAYSQQSQQYQYQQQHQQQQQQPQQQQLSTSSKLFSYYLSEESSDITESIW